MFLIQLDCSVQKYCLKKLKKMQISRNIQTFSVFGLQLYKNATHVFKHTANLYLQIHLIGHSLT